MSSQIESIARECETPAYLADPNRLLSNLSELRDAVRSHYQPAEVAYSVKTNPLAAFIRRAFLADFHPEVVSAAELDYVLGLGADASKVILNGPSKTPELLADALAKGVFINVDSIEELAAIRELGFHSAPIGVRIAVDLVSDTRSRFGIDLGGHAALGQVREFARTLNIVGIHIHHSSDRSATSFTHRLEIAVDAAADLGLARLSIIDLGGGFASDMPEAVRARVGYDVASYAEYGEAIGKRAQQILGDSGTTVALEPGIGVLADTMSFVSTVRSIKDRPQRKLAMLDGSIFEINPLRSSNGPIAELIGREPAAGGLTHLFGGTCMEVDDLGTIDADLKAGDRILFGNVGAYTLTLAPDFIVPRSAVIDVATGNVLRQPLPLAPVGGQG